MNPHNRRRGIDPPGQENRRWLCVYCGQSGLWDELEALECTFVYPPCEYCGLTPECAPDCKGIMAILGSKNVHVVTDDVQMKARVEHERNHRGQA
jgi:hypothetical protein